MKTHEIVAETLTAPMKSHASTRDTTQLLLQRAREVGQRNIAKATGMSESTVSRWFSENVEALSESLSFMGLKVVPADSTCINDTAALDNIVWLAQRGAASLSVDDLLKQEYAK